MHTSLWLIVGILLSVTSFDDRRSTPAEATIIVIPATAEHQATIAEAVAAFEAAGLQVPSAKILFSDDKRDCAGHLGLFQPAPEQWRITICSELAFVPVHELAHAWIEANVDKNTQRAYIELRGMASWNSSSDDWNERGVEDAAFVIQQNVTAADLDHLTNEWERRAAAYELLVGAPSPLRND